jgi:FkbM family methyltransferase
MKALKRKIKAFFYRFGLRASYSGVSRIQHLDGISRCLPKSEARVVFDVGANRGQTLEYLYPYFTNAHFYCFEPDPQTYFYLERAAKTLDRVNTFNLALGPSNGQRTLYANEASEGSSLLKVSTTISQTTAPGWLRKHAEKEVTVMSLDCFCRKHEIKTIDLLKIDTQGFEGQVLRGASEMLGQKGIRLVFCEVLFSEYYEEQDYFDDVYSLLKSSGYKLVDLYQKFRSPDGALTACDALFSN